MEKDLIRMQCLVGASAGRRVLLGFAPACQLYSLSFADVLDEDSGRGYQRRFNSRHSLDFRRYIQNPGSSTIPLTFNLRPCSDGAWRIEEAELNQAVLFIDPRCGKVMAQVDCQHRLGHLNDVTAILPFMCFIGLSAREEMEVFNVINGKARGLSRSLIDFHDAQLAGDLGRERPELLVALCLTNDQQSPWFRQLDLGGSSTSGLTRRASLRTMQKAVKRFLMKTKLLSTYQAEDAAEIVRDYWSAVAFVFAAEWGRPRNHLLTKGIGVYALMDIAADIVGEIERRREKPTFQKFVQALHEFSGELDWTSSGPLQGLGGEGGVKSAVEIIRAARRKASLRVVRNGQ